MRRREFLPLAALAWRDAPAWSGTRVEPVFRKPPAYFAYRDKIAGGAAAIPATARSNGPKLFAEVTGTVLDSEQLARGIPYWLAHLDPATGIDIYGNNGVACGDIDGDGVDEIYVCQPAGLPNKLFRWRDGKLEDATAAAQVDLLDDTSAALFVDLRNLGRQDLVVLRGAGPLLFLNDGAGRFTLAPDAFRFATPARGAFTGMAAADYDRDGKVDLYCCCYSFFQSEAQYTYPTPYHDAQNGPPNFLFRNRLNADGSGFFEDATAAAGLSMNNNRFSFAPAWCDYDGSGWPSLYVANDFGRNNLYKNDGGKFHDVAAAAGVDDIGPGMSAAWFDDNGDGRPDLYVANMWTAAGQAVVATPEFRRRFPESQRDAWRRHTRGNSFYRNRGDGTFEDAGAERGIEMGRWAWSADAADFDNDGVPEIFIACGMLTGGNSPDLESFFWREVVAKSPPDATRNAPYEEGWNALNQFIREGYSWNGHEANVFYRRHRDSSVESGLDFAGDSRAFAVTDFDGDGCVDLIVKNRLGPQLRLFQNRCGQGAPRVGLRLTGKESNRDAIGARVRIGRQTKWVTAGSGYLSQHTKTLNFGSPEGEEAEIVWPSGKRQMVAELAAGALYEVTEGGAAVRRREFAKAAAINPKPAAGDNTAGPADVWLQDPVPLPERKTGPGLFVLTEATGDRAAAYSLFRRYLLENRTELELPLALLLDANGHAVKLYAGPPDERTVKTDLATIARRPALPYPGRAIGQPRRDYFKLGAALAWSGYGEYALPYFELALRGNRDNTRALVLTAQIHREAGRLDAASELLDRALQLDPGLAEAWNEAGGVALARNRPDEAQRDFERALEAKPDLLYALLNAGQTAERLKRPAEAERYFRRAADAHPRSGEALNGFGLLLAKAGRNDESERLLRQAVEFEPALWQAANNLAVLFLRSGRPRDAERVLENGIVHAPSEEALYLNLGRLHLQAGDREKARGAMRRLLAVKPESETARRALTDLEK